MHSTGSLLLSSFLRLIRWKNLLISLVALLLIAYFGIGNAYRDSGLVALTPPFQLALLIISVLFIMGAGYIINDLMDIETDIINCPDRVVINKTISAKAALWIYYSMTVIGVAFGAILAVLLNQISLLFIFPGAALSLYLYSYSFKKSFLAGNVIIASLTAIIMILPWIIEVHQIEQYPLMPPSIFNALMTSGLISLFFGSFAFITTLIREWIKDLQDLKGDSLTGARTMAATKNLSYNLYAIKSASLITIILILVFQVYLLFNDKIAAAVSLLAPMLLLGKVIFRLSQKNDTIDWKQLSDLLKWIMCMGILSLLFFGIKL